MWRATLASLLAAGLLALTLVLPGGKDPAQADLDAMAAETLHGHVPSNTIAGNPIKVCGDYPNTAKKAIAEINSGLRSRSYVDFDVFTHVSACPTRSSSVDRVDYVKFEAHGPATLRCRPGVGACVRALDRLSGAPLYTYFGDMLIHVSTDAYNLSDDTTTSPSVARAVLSMAMHEMGHVLGFAEAYVFHEDDGCVSTIGGRPSVMGCDLPTSFHTYDYENYAAIYKPNVPERIYGQDAPPEAENVADKPGTVKFNFNPSRVKVEHSIEIRRLESGVWGEPLTGGTIPRNNAMAADATEYSVEITGQTAGTQTYGLFSTTQAYLPGQATITKSGVEQPIGFVRTVTFTVTGPPPVGSFSLNLQTSQPLSYGFLRHTGTTNFFELNDEVTVTAHVGTTPAPGYGVLDWIGHCTNIAAPAKTCRFVFQGTPRTITTGVTFGPKLRILTSRLSASTSDNTDPLVDTDGHRIYAQGTRVTVTAAPASGFHIKKWGRDCHPFTAPSDTTCTLTMDAPKTASAEFERACSGQQRLTLRPRSQFKVRPSAANDTYECGAYVTVTALPTLGEYLHAWGGYCEGYSSQRPCAFSMNGPRTVTATFQQAAAVPPGGTTHALTLSPGSNGTLVASPNRALYPENELVTVTAIPDSGYQLTGWGNACSAAAASEPTCAVTMDGPKEVSATFATCTGTHTLTVTVGTNGSVSPGSGTYRCNTTVTLRASPNANHQVDSWGGDCSGSGPTCTLTMNANKTASVTFRKVDRTLTTSAGTNGSVSPSPGRHTYPHGASVTVTATPDSGYEVANWSGDCSGDATTCVLTMDSDKTAVVTFESESSCTGSQTLALTVGSGGRATKSPDKSSYDCGDSVVITAVPNSGHRIGAWGGDCAGTSAATTTCRLTMNSNRTASVSFVRQYTLTTSAGSGGSISPAPGTHTYDSGSAVTVTATPNSGYRIDAWGGDCAGTSATTTTCRLTMNSNRTASVSFVRQYTLTTSAGSGGSISPAPGTHTYDSGSAVTVTATPNSGYQIDAWGGDCAGTSARTTTCRLTTNADKAASVTFRKCELRVLSAGNGTVGGGGTVDCGKRRWITATPDTNYCHERWRGQFGVSSEESTRGPRCHPGGRFSVTPDRDVTYTAYFVKRQQTLTTSAGANGSISPSGSNDYDYDASVTVTATPDNGYVVSTWTGACSGTTGATCRIPNMNVDRTAGVTFKLLKYTLTVNGGTGSGTYLPNTVVDISAPAGMCLLGQSLIFDNWTGDVADSDSRTTTVTMDGDKTVTANYTAHDDGNCAREEDEEGEGGG